MSKLARNVSKYAHNASQHVEPVSQRANRDSSNAHYVSEITYILGYHTNSAKYYKGNSSDNANYFGDTIDDARLNTGYFRTYHLGR